MNLTPSEYEALERRLEANRRKRMPACKESMQEYAPAEREVGKGGLHEQIMEWCDAQWPRWKYIHARTDQKSTIGAGVHDFTIYAPNGRVFNIECKAKGGKLSPEQQAWIKELEMNDHEVATVVSLENFFDVVKSSDRATDKQIRDWADTHGISDASLPELRAAFEDARSQPIQT